MTTTLEEFRDDVDLYSADLSRWPTEKVKPALALMEGEAAAKDYFDAARAAEDELRAYDPQPADTAALEARIMAAVQADPAQEEPGAGMDFAAHLAAQETAKIATRNDDAARTTTVKWRAAWLFAPGGGLLAAAILGFIIGVLPHRASSDYLVDPGYYAQDQIVNSDSDLLNDGGIF